MEAVTVQFYKHPRTLHWGFAGYFIGEDEHGRWVGLPRGTRRWKGEIDHPPTGEDAVQCFPHEGWWVLHYNGPVRPISAFVDIATQPVVAPGRIEMVDLDLDVVGYADGSVEIVDEDEFAVHQIELGYTTDMVRRARSETELVVDLLWRGQEPFFTVAEGWLEQVATGSFPSQG